MRLGTLEDSLRKCVHQDSLQHLFNSSAGLTFTNQVAPLVRGRNKLPRMEVPAYTADYVLQSLQKLYTPTAKRQATEMGPETTPHTTVTAQVPRPAPTTYAAAVTPVTPTTQVTMADTTSMEDSSNKDIKHLQSKAQEHNDTLAELLKVCVSLAATQQHMSNNMATYECRHEHQILRTCHC